MIASFLAFFPYFFNSCWFEYLSSEISRFAIRLELMQSPNFLLVFPRICITDLSFDLYPYRQKFQESAFARKRTQVIWRAYCQPIGDWRVYRILWNKKRYQRMNNCKIYNFLNLKIPINICLLYSRTTLLHSSLSTSWNYWATKFEILSKMRKTFIFFSCRPTLL